MFCRQCQNLCPDDAVFCAKCGFELRMANVPVVQKGATPLIETQERGKVAEGCLGSVLIGIPIILVGSVMCLTIIGAIIGIPLILFGLACLFGMPVLSPFTKAKILRGTCPYCGTEMQVSPYLKGIDCPACQKRSIIRDDMLIRADNITQ